MSTADLLTFPPIDTTEVKPYPAEARAIATLTQTALAPLLAIEANLCSLAERYRDVAFDLKTTKGLAAMKAARYDLRENGRYLVNRAVQKCKDDANAAKKAVEQEAVRLVAITEPRETEFDEAIVARENEIAAEKNERDRIEFERVAKHRAGIETIRGYVAQAQGKTAAQITAGITALMALSFGDEWQEFRDEAAEAAIETRDAIVAMRDAAEAREAEAAGIEAQRIEQARVAAEQKAEADRLAAERAAMEAERAAIAAERAAADAARMEIQRRQLEADEAQERAAAALAEQQRFEAELDAQNSQRQESAVPPAQADSAAPQQADAVLGGGPALQLRPDGTPKTIIRIELDDTPALEILSAPTLKLGAMSARLGFVVTREFIDAQLGFAPALVERRGHGLWQETDFPLICASIAAHVLAIGERAK